tara:strand:+ start:231 stop:1154 length:924 start_codon:yes stop_codon:yes gene_type:complete
MNEQILVIGSEGFLGKHVKRILEEQEKDYIEITGKKHIDITNNKELEEFIKNYDIHSIINCAAFVGGISFGYKYQADLLQKNIIMSGNIYSAAISCDVKRVINPISNCAYPGNLDTYEESKFWDGPPHSSVFNYGLAKRITVGLGKSFYEQYNLSSMNVILSNMYGPEDHFEEERSHALGALIKKIFDAKKENKKSIEIWGTGKPIREWLYVEDGANSLIKSLDLDPDYYFFNIGINKGYSITAIAETIANEIQWEGEFTYNTDKPDGVMKKTVNGEKGSKILKWEPEVDLSQGIKKTVEWYLEKNG